MAKPESKNLEILDVIAKLPTKDKTTIRFFERAKSNSFDRYTVHGDDALFIAHEVRGSKESLKYDGKGSLPYVPISQVQFEAEAREILLSHQYSIQVYSKQSNKWIIQSEASPGNLGFLEDVLYSAKENLASRGLLSLTRGNNNDLGIMYIDSLSNMIEFCYFEDDSHFSTLESVLMMLAPKEAIVPKNISRSRSVIELKLNQNGVRIKQVPRDVELDIVILNNCINELAMKESLAKQACAMIDAMSDESRILVQQSLFSAISYLGFNCDTSRHRQFSFKEIKLKSFIKLDAAAVSSLNLFPNSKDLRKGIRVSKGDKKTIFSLLNRCRTIPGERLLSQWIRQPLMDLDKIEERLEMVDFFMKEGATREKLHEHLLRRIPDLSRLAKKFAQQSASLVDCYQMYLCIQQLPHLVSALGHENEFVNKIFSEPMSNMLKKLNKFKTMIEDTIDLERVKDQREFRIKKDYDEELGQLCDQLDDLERQVRKIHRNVFRDLELKEQEVKCIPESTGYVFGVTNRNERLIRNKRDYEIVTSAKKEGIRFTTRALTPINDEYVTIYEQYKDKEKNVISEIMEVVQTYSEPVHRLGELVSTLDVFVAFAVAASSSPGNCYIRPSIKAKDSGIISIKQLRHPCLEAQDVEYIPNDVNLDKSKHSFLIITGPNMGGKSTYIRSIGIAVLMAQIGSFVSAESATISIVDGIYTRIGASDKQLLGNSTFMTEMVETASILRSASEHSLVIIDELGRGTSTFDGFGLAWSISKHIALELKSYCLFATHYHELTELSQEIAAISNLCVSVYTSDNEITMMYEVKEGVSEESLGIHVAKAAQFPPEMIEVAKRKLEELESAEKLLKKVDLENILSKVNKFDVSNASDDDILSFVAQLKEL